MSYSANFPIYLILITSIYTIIILILLQKIQWSEVNKQLLVKSLLLIIICSIIITLIINWYFDWNCPWHLFFINTFLWVVGWLSLIIYLIKYKKEGWYPFMFTVIIISATAFMTISAFVFMPILFNQTTGINSIDEDYINENIKGVIYSDYAGMNFETNKIREKFIFFIFNNGTENKDEDLQLSISFLPDKNFTLTKPNDKNHLSYNDNKTKPLVFGDKKNTIVRWNKTLPITTLSTMEAQWAIIYLETDVRSEDFFDYRHSISFSAIINDIYFINVKKMPIYVDPPSENPKYWDISEVIKDIERNIHK